MLSIFSCAFWPSVCLLWRNVCLGLLSFFWLCSLACRILVPWTGIKPGPLAVKGWNPNHWTTREFPAQFLIWLFFLILSCMSCLYILEINPLLVASFANIFSHSMGCLFVFCFCVCVCVCVCWVFIEVCRLFIAVCGLL